MIHREAESRVAKPPLLMGVALDFRRCVRVS
jgi:hypothetical protein